MVNLIILILAIAVSETVLSQAIGVGFINLKLDQFNAESNHRRFHLQYHFNFAYHERGAPIFINVGGEYQITADDVTNGHFHDMARQHGACLFSVEHRFYGSSVPTNDLSLESLRYLNMRQALLDLAEFIQTIKALYIDLAYSKVILHGYSYSGGMAIWFKHLYPDLVHGVWASSPAVFGKLEFFEMADIVGDAIRQAKGPYCCNALRQGYAELEQFIKTHNHRDLKLSLNICPNFDSTNQMDVLTFFSMVNTIFTDEVMFHGPTRKGINRFCDQLTTAEGPLTGMIRIVHNKFDHEPCSDVTYKTTVSYMADTSVDFIDSVRLFNYQKCYEFGWFSTSRPKNQILKYIPISYHIRQCADAFDPYITLANVEHAITQIKLFYQNLPPQHDNIVVTHGQLDPWRAVGVLSHLSVETIPMVGHGQDRESVSEADPPHLRHVKGKLNSLFNDWIMQSY